MTTTGIESWAVDLAEVGAIYPFPGTEWLCVLIGVVAWIVWHIWCIRWEKGYHEEKLSEYGDDSNIKKALNND